MSFAHIKYDENVDEKENDGRIDDFVVDLCWLEDVTNRDGDWVDSWWFDVQIDVRAHSRKVQSPYYAF